MNLIFLRFTEVWMQRVLCKVNVTPFVTYFARDPLCSYFMNLRKMKFISQIENPLLVLHESVSDIDINESLSEKQKHLIREVCKDYEDVLSYIQGWVFRVLKPPQSVLPKVVNTCQYWLIENFSCWLVKYFISWSVKGF